MQIGKLPPELLESIVFKKLISRRDDILVRSEMGQDSCIVDMQGMAAVLSTDPITGQVENIGWFAIHVACNDLAANGAEPVGALLTLLLPPNIEKEQIDKIMSDANQAAQEINIEILGGHTEITDAVTRPIVSTVALGKTPTQRLIISNNVQDQLDIVLTKGAGIEGTAILAEYMLKNGLNQLPETLLKRALSFAKKLSVVPESRIALDVGVEAMHDVTEGGLLGALYEVAGAGQAGFIVNREDIPVHQETQAICDALNVDVLRLISSGSMLIYTYHGHEMVNALQEQGIDARIIGHTTAEKQYILVEKGKAKQVEAPASDEVWRILNQGA